LIEKKNRSCAPSGTTFEKRFEKRRICNNRKARKKTLRTGQPSIEAKKDLRGGQVRGRIADVGLEKISDWKKTVQLKRLDP